MKVLLVYQSGIFDIEVIESIVDCPIIIDPISMAYLPDVKITDDYDLLLVAGSSQAVYNFFNRELPVIIDFPKEQRLLVINDSAQQQEILWKYSNRYTLRKISDVLCDLNITFINVRTNPRNQQL